MLARIYLKRSLSLEGSASEIFLRSVDLIESMIVRIIETNPKPKNQSGKVTRFNRRQPSESNSLVLTRVRIAAKLGLP